MDAQQPSADHVVNTMSDLITAVIGVDPDQVQDRLIQAFPWVGNLSGPEQQAVLMEMVATATACQKFTTSVRPAITAAA